LHLRAVGLNETRMPRDAQRQATLIAHVVLGAAAREEIAIGATDGLGFVLHTAIITAAAIEGDEATGAILEEERDLRQLPDQGQQCLDVDRGEESASATVDQAVMTSGEEIFDRVESAPEGESSPRLVLTSKVPVRDPRGRIIGVAGISRTIEQLRDGRQQLGRLDMVAARLHEDPAAAHRTADLAHLAGLSPSQFERTFRRAFGTTPHRHLLRLRIEAACRRLRESDESIATIALGCGFADHAHFTRTFRRVMGMAPTEYRRK